MTFVFMVVSFVCGDPFGVARALPRPGRTRPSGQGWSCCYATKRLCSDSEPAISVHGSRRSVALRRLTNFVSIFVAVLFIEKTINQENEEK
jgi:hypothetical protein